MTRRAKLCLDFGKKEKLHEHRLDARVMVDELLGFGLVRVVDVYHLWMGSTELRPELRWAEGLTKEEALAAYRTLKQLRAEHRMQQCRESVRKIEQGMVGFGLAVRKVAPAFKQLCQALDGFKRKTDTIWVDDMVE